MTFLSPRSIFLAIVLALSGLSAQAQNQGGGGVCKADAQKLCKDIQPGGGRVLTCLNRNANELSPACKEQMPNLIACDDAMRKICGGSGPRKVRECVRDNADRLKAACQGHEPGVP
jgi:hypothetical protein